ncbi:hypothetical protein [Streptomyces fradiae]
MLSEAVLSGAVFMGGCFPA